MRVTHEKLRRSVMRDGDYIYCSNCLRGLPEGKRAGAPREG